MPNVLVYRYINEHRFDVERKRMSVDRIVKMLMDEMNSVDKEAYLDTIFEIEDNYEDTYNSICTAYVYKEGTGMEGMCIEFENNSDLKKVLKKLEKECDPWAEILEPGFERWRCSR